MSIKAKEYGPKHTPSRHESDIYSVSDTEDGLVILIDTVDENNTRRDLKISFEYNNGYRYLDEGDLIRYWDSGQLSTPYHVYEILSGGWSNGEALEPGMLSISSSSSIREWFVVTTNGCITVLCDSEPACEFIGSQNWRL